MRALIIIPDRHKSMQYNIYLCQFDNAINSTENASMILKSSGLMLSLFHARIFGYTNPAITIN